MDASLLGAAIDCAREHETSASNDLAAEIEKTTAAEPHNEVLGPVRERGEPNGIVLRHGYIVAEWGDTERVDMTFSVTKSYLSTIAGLALERGLIGSVQDPVRQYVEDGALFDPPHNSRITWHHLLQQTSEWEGTLWGKPHYADSQGGQGRGHTPQRPGSVFAYNDVRTNLLSLSLLHVWRKPLPRVLGEEVMEPIGASDTWRWHGYHNSWVEIDGVEVQSVSGGGHWGGGLWISTRDHARFGHLFLRRGSWRRERVISEEWVELATRPCPLKPTYGYMWWLNTDRALYPGASESSYYALGSGKNLIWIEPAQDVVAVVRWIAPDRCNEFMRLLMAAVDRNGQSLANR